MQLARQIGGMLYPSNNLPASLENPATRAALVQAIDGPSVQEIVYAAQPTAEMYELLARRARPFISEITDLHQICGLSLRVWAGCIEGAKTISFETMDGPNTPEQRRAWSVYLTSISSSDFIERCGLEASPFFRMLSKQGYFIEGILRDSPILAYVRTFPWIIDLSEFSRDGSGTVKLSVAGSPAPKGFVLTGVDAEFRDRTGSLLRVEFWIHGWIDGNRTEIAQGRGLLFPYEAGILGIHRDNRLFEEGALELVIQGQPFDALRSSMVLHIAIP